MRCDFCGREWIFVWPELWPYRYEGKVFCSENCKICDSTLIKLGRGKKKLMSRMKKDGTPARKPGPKAKKRIETPEGEIVTTITKEPPKPLDGGEWEKLETPEAPKRAPLVYDGFTVCCIESKTFGRFYWDRDHNHLDWTTAEGEEVSFTPAGWKMFLEELPKVAEILGGGTVSGNKIQTIPTTIVTGYWDPGSVSEIPESVKIVMANGKKAIYRIAIEQPKPQLLENLEKFSKLCVGYERKEEA